jgi:hypothetical protein
VSSASALTSHPCAPVLAAREHRRLGYARELRGDVPGALAAYDSALARLTSALPSADRAVQLELALVQMNRGNALQQFSEPSKREAALVAYDRALELFSTLPAPQSADVRLSLGAAWLNRGRALQLTRSPADCTAAVGAHESAIAVLRELPLGAAPAVRRNLAGAWLNLADALLESDLADRHERARTAAAQSLSLTHAHANTHLEFADLDLKARRAAVAALGHRLVAVDQVGTTRDALAREATETLTAGLTLSRAWERRGVTTLRPLALRLFRFAVRLARVHAADTLPHLVEENILQPDAPFSSDKAFHFAARESLADALGDFRRPQLLHLGDSASMQQLELHRTLRTLLARFETPMAATFS